MSGGWGWHVLAVLAGFASGLCWWGLPRSRAAVRRPPDSRAPAVPAASARGGPGHRARGPAADAPAVPVIVLADLLVALLEAGLPPGPALTLLHQQLALSGLRPGPGLPALESAMALADRTGLAPSPLIRAAAAERFRAESAARTEAANRLGVLVSLPVGLCLLPAFVCATVVPMVLGLLR